MQKQKVKGYTRMVYNPKKQKLEKKKLRIKKTHLILIVLLTALSVITYQYQALIKDINEISHTSQSKRQEVAEATNTQELTNEATTRQIEGYNPIFKFRPKTKHTSSEYDAYEAVIEACRHHGLDNENCRQDLMGIAYAETRDFTNKIGDAGKSFGIMQIHLGYHRHITVEQANDIYFATKWTLARMIHNNYKTNRDVAIMKHNGTPNTSRTLAYLQTVNSYVNK
jgi:hypothetical protein